MSISNSPGTMRTTYQQWQEAEGLPVVRGFYVEDLRGVELRPWARKGGQGAFIDMEGTGGTNAAYVCEIPPGGKLAPQRHLYEEVIYVLTGRGATSVWLEGGPRLTFEWQAGSLFAIPLNAFHQHFNASGTQPARYYAVTSAPLVMNLFHNHDFIFDNPFVFRDRFTGEPDAFSGKGTFLASRIWEANFIPDVNTFQLIDWKERGAGGSNIMFELANNTLIAHISEFPVGTYKKAHRHGPGANVIILSGQGYSLLWPDGQPWTKVDWHDGSVFVPPDYWWHQHFNAGPTPARYLAIRWGSVKHKLDDKHDRLAENRASGGNQIEYEDEDPAVRELFEAELAKAGARSRMPAVTRR
ncbi:MAG TPA: cupin domain-containing protein [Methylomirabilota bacterium]|jgi:quercetin dioxygenase-like cupin family protein|nr:cupin domain-containing protein [Methylomirabilota bacterium]